MNTPTEKTLADCTDAELKGIGYDHFRSIHVKRAVIARMQKEIATHEGVCQVVDAELERRKADGEKVTETTPTSKETPAVEPPVTDEPGS